MKQSKERTKLIYCLLSFYFILAEIWVDTSPVMFLLQQPHQHNGSKHQNHDNNEKECSRIRAGHGRDMCLLDL